MLGSDEVEAHSRRGDSPKPPLTNLHRMNIDKPTLGSLRTLMMASATCAILGAMPTSALAYINGLDVYTGDGTVTWSSVKAGGYDFAFVKADEGVNAPDAKFATNMSGANAAGVYVGPYHFAHVESLSPAGTVKFDNYTGGAFAYDSPIQVNRDAWTDATLEAVDFIKRIRPYYQQTGTTHYLPPVSDIEQAFMPNTDTQAHKTEFVSNWAKLFSDTVYDALGVRPILYVSKSSANTNFTASVAALQPFWEAWYKGTGTSSPPVHSDTPSFPNWSFWQWSDGTDTIAQNSQIPGTVVSTDRDVYSGTLSQLAAMTVKVVQGDYNHNATVDASDYVTWRKEMSLPTGQYNAYSVTFLGADGNLSNKVDAGDYTYWRSQFGKTLSGSGAGSGLDSSGVSEPWSISLLLSGIFSLMSGRPRR
jgi:GH25 family lysozyme M1 (1,4-beta-N-acetylmuramidase)